MPDRRFSSRSPLAVPALLAVGDPGRDRTVYATILLLAALGFGLIMLAVWLIRHTRPDPEVLAPLERMGERKWRRTDPVWQRRGLDEVRPPGAEPLDPAAAPPKADADFDRGPQPIGFDDLATGAELTALESTEIEAFEPTVDLPAPSNGAVAVDAPTPDGDADVAEAVTDVEGEGDTVAVPATTVPAGEEGTAGDAGVHADEPAGEGGDAEGDGGDDDDITGEQDADEFFAALDGVPVRDLVDEAPVGGTSVAEVSGGEASGGEASVGEAAVDDAPLAVEERVEAEADPNSRG